MKTNVSIELNDQQRDYLATLIDDKQTVRLASRAEVTALVEQFIGGVVAQAEYSGGKADVPEAIMYKSDPTLTRPPMSQMRDLYTIDQEDIKILKGKDPSFVRGWNQVKRSSQMRKQA